MIRKRFFAALIAVGMMICAFVVQAEIKTYTGVGEDYANQFETQEDAKLRAKRIAIEDAKKHAGVGLKTYSRTVNSELVDDEISTITSNSYKIVGDVKYEQILKPLTDRITVIVWRATVDVDVDDSEVKTWARRTADEKKDLINRNRAAEEAFNENIKSAGDLKRRAAVNLTETEEKNLKREVKFNNNDFQVNQIIEDGNRLNYEDKPDEAIEKYGEALEIKLYVAEGYYYSFDDERLDIPRLNAEKETLRQEKLKLYKERAKKEALEQFAEKVGEYVDSSNMPQFIEIIEENYEMKYDEFAKTIIIAKVTFRYNSNYVDKWIAEQKKKIER